MTDTLYKVTDVDGVDNWTDISPGSDEIPVRPHDLAIDIADNDTVNTHITSSNTWYQSDNAGDSWTTKATSDEKRVFYSASTSIASGGTDKVMLSLDGTNFEDKTGNLETAIGAIGTIKRIQPL